MRRPQMIEPGPENLELAHFPKSGLCHRCENRAHALETGAVVKQQCLELDKSVKGCHAWRPVRPVVVIPEDEKPIFGETGNSTKLNFVRTAKDRDVKLMVINVRGDGISAIWRK